MRINASPLKLAVRPAVAAVLALSLAVPAALAAQAPRSEGGLELTIGGVLAFYADHPECPPDAFLDAVQTSLKYHLAAGGPIAAIGLEVTSVLDGMYPWPWPSALGFPLDHDGGVRVTANLFANLLDVGRLDVDLVAGAGLRRYGEGNGEADFVEDIPASEVYRIRSQSNPMVLYGVVADVAVTDRLSLQGNVRGNTTFTGDLDILDPSGGSMVLDVGTQSFVQVTVGVGVRLGS